MAASLNEWLHTSLLSYSAKNASDLSVVVKGQKMQIVKVSFDRPPFLPSSGRVRRRDRR